MEQSTKQRSSAAKIAIAIGAVVFVAVLSTLLQQWMLGKTNVAITSGVIAVSTVSLWRQFWGNAK